MAQEDTDLVRLQVNVKAGTRRKLKALAVEHECEMGDVCDAILSHMLPLLSVGKAPAQIVAAIEKAAKDRAKGDDAE